MAERRRLSVWAVAKESFEFTELAESGVRHAKEDGFHEPKLHCRNRITDLSPNTYSGRRAAEMR